MIPRLIHPVPVTIKQLDRSATVMDDNAGEPIGRAATDAAVILEAQVKWKALGKPQPEFAGPREKDKVYLLFRHLDLTAATVTIKRGDRFVLIGTRTVNLYVTYFEDRGHYTDQGGATLLTVWLGDRRPSEQDGDL